MKFVPLTDEKEIDSRIMDCTHVEVVKIGEKITELVFYAHNDAILLRVVKQDAYSDALVCLVKDVKKETFYDVEGSIHNDAGESMIAVESTFKDKAIAEQYIDNLRVMYGSSKVKLVITETKVEAID